jgi:Zn-dependent M28 family amino/carboxypeptidase
MNTLKIFMTVLTCAFASCANKSTPVAQQESIAAAPEFNADSAYMYIEKQVSFGPRVPNSPAHKACGDYLIGELKRFGAQVHVQEATLTAYNGDRLQARNIIASYNTSNPKRIMLFAHWDSRPYADNDPDPETRRTPIDGADDGASGVGILLEIARQVNAQGSTQGSAGIDIIFFDAEDYGPPSFDIQSYTTDPWWCLGSQFWARNPHTPNYKATYGILLDMVGAKDATFYREETSVKRASSVIDKVWGEARDLGFGKYFLNARGGYITDDHQYVIAGRNIPCIDIINYNTENTHGFGDYWHTHDDTLDNISRETLRAVGQTVMGVICKP